MTKKIAIILAAALLITACFAGCKKDNEDTVDESITAGEGLENGDEYDLVEDEDGNIVAVVYDDDGNAYKIDENGKKTRKKVKVAKKAATTTTAPDKSNQGVSTPNKTPVSDNKTETAEGTTSDKLTTLPKDEIIVPSTSAKGTPVKFSDEDVATVTYMLEVPYLYTASYENANGVPISIANHAACWMAQKNGANSTSFASGDIVLNLFRYFAQTVINYKDNCNTDKSADKAPITYNSSNDTFTIIAKESDSIEKKTHSVTIQSIEFLGNNNYYKVTASVKAENSSGCSAKKVVAVMQKNKLDPSLGFSVKALKWS